MRTELGNNGVVRVGVIGAGRIGRIHLQNLMSRVAGATAAGVYDIKREAACDAAAPYGVPVAPDYRSLLEDPTVDAVAICSPTDTHAQLILEAADAGKHVFCEKPIDVSLGPIDRALCAVERAGVKLQVGFNRRFDPSFAEVRETVAAGRVGVPHLLRITSRDPEPPSLAYVQASGGMFVDMTIHDLDMARYLVGAEVEEVYAAASVLVDPRYAQAEDVDTAIVLLRFAGGAIGAIDNSRRAAYGYDQRVEVFGSGGMAAASNETPDRLMVADAHGVHTSRPLYFFLERYAESFVNEMDAFARCVREDTPPPVTGRDGRLAVLLAMAACRSHVEHRAVAVSEITA